MAARGSKGQASTSLNASDPPQKTSFIFLFVITEAQSLIFLPNFFPYFFLSLCLCVCLYLCVHVCGRAEDDLGVCVVAENVLDVCMWPEDGLYVITGCSSESAGSRKQLTRNCPSE